MKPNTKILIGIALPIIVIVAVILIALVPKLMFTPKYNFIYATGGACGNEPRITSYCAGQYYGGNNPSWYPYKVQDNKVTRETTFPLVSVYDDALRTTVQRPITVTTYPTLYLYDVSKDTFTALSLEEAQKYAITNGGSAPDGTVVVNDQYGSRGLIGEILGGGSPRGYFLKNGAYNKKIVVKNGSSDDYYYGTRDFQFLGWVTGTYVTK